MRRNITITTTRARFEEAWAKIVLTKISKISGQITAVASVSLACGRGYATAESVAVESVVARIALADIAIHRELETVDTRLLASGSHPMICTLSASRNTSAKVIASSTVIAIVGTDRNITARS